MRKSGAVAIVAIAAIAILEAIALLQGIDGQLLMTVIAVIAGLTGWVFPQPEQIETLKKWLKN